MKRLWVFLAGLVVVVGSVVGYAIRTSHAADVVDGLRHWPAYHDYQQMLRSTLADPDSARFSGLYFRHADGRDYMCGMVNARNRSGGYNGTQPFYVAPGSALIFDVDDAGSAYSIERICTR